MHLIAHDLADPLAPFPPLFRDLIGGGPAAAAFFTYDHRDPDSFVRRAAWLDEREASTHEGSVREAVARALVEQNLRLGAHARALESARALAQRGTLAVVTGQQAGLLGGPLYTLFKAVTAVRLAADLSARLGRPVVPVFWLATEDHDYEEVAQTWVVDRHGRLRRLRLPRAEDARRSVGDVPVPPAAESVVAEFAAALGPQGAALAGRLLDAARASGSLGEWCARLLADWLSPHGLVLLDPMDPALRRPLRGLFASALLRREAVYRELAAAATRIERRGGVPALTHGPEHTHLFLYHEGRRLALLWGDGGLSDRDGRVRLTVAEAARLIQESPERFSPGVVLRPVAQDMLLPTLAFVVGPGEAQYLAQAGGVYRLFGLQMPVLVPRLSLTLVPPEVADALREHGVGAAEFLGDPDGPRRRVLERLDRIGIEAVMGELRRRVDDAYEKAARELAELHSLQDVVRGTLARVRFQLDYLEAKAWQHHRRRHRELLRSLETAASWLAPGGALQERTLGAAQFVARYGEALIRALLRLPVRGGHQIGLIEGVDGGAEEVGGDQAHGGAPARDRAAC